MESFTTYFTALQAANLTEITEHSLRPELKNLLSAIANSVDRKINILHEGKREGKFGAPDFKVTRVDNIIGYVENKKVGEPLDHILKSDQIKKYQQLSDNILITNYLEWIWLNKGNIQRKTLCDPADLEQKRATLEQPKIEAVYSLIAGFFSFAPEGIGKPKELAAALALRGKVLKEFLAEELQRQAGQAAKGKLFGLYQTFQKYVFNELTLPDFADTFAQNVIYGLFLARLTADTTAITLHNAELFIPTNFELIRELVEFLKVLQRKEYTDIRWVLEEIVTILNTMNLRDIKAALSFTAAKDLTENDDPYAAKDPYIYFYEDFLAAYDQKLRKAKGVYYTPPQVVNFIVRAVDEILQETFHLSDGLADHERVTVLDFAVGTGTFLLEVIRQIFQKYPRPGEQQLLIREHILKNCYGFEYLLAPYTIAHLKLSQFLKDHGYDLSKSPFGKGQGEVPERLQIYLTNTLEPTDRQLQIPLLPALTEETKHAQAVKDKPILVIMGNPPYSYQSKNTGKWISEKIKAYYLVDGKKLEEKNPKGLQDDYVKFIRFAQDKMDRVAEGIVAVITNHSFLDNPTFRGMRQSLLQTFDRLYFIDLHGNAKKKENTPEGGKDENVFDIEQGVAISIMVKKHGIEKRIYHADFWGTRENKYQLSLERQLKDVEWVELRPNSPFYLFQYREEKLVKTYHTGWKVTEIFGIGGAGVNSSRDRVVIDFTKEPLIERAKIFKHSKASDEELCKQLDMPVKFGWNIQKARELIQQDSDENLENYVKSIIYRPFDKRFIFYHDSLVWRTVKKVMLHMLKPNIALFIGRQGQAIGAEEWNIVFCGDLMEDYNLYRRGNNVCFPVYVYEKPEGLFANGPDFIKTENFKKAFRQFIDRRYHKHYTPEEIVGYIYAVLHSPTYRTKYAEFLKMDFPRIPFPEDLTGFENLSDLGWQLIQAHLLNEIPAYDLGSYGGEGDHMVIKPDYRQTKEYERLYINQTQYFEHVPEHVYQFHIGGYQVLDKYLKDRKGRALTLAEVKNIKNIVKVLAFTLAQMQQIEAATKDWI